MFCVTDQLISPRCRRSLAACSTAPIRHPSRFSALRFARTGAAPLSIELQRRFEERFGLPVIAGYGLSEATCTVTMNPPTGERRRLGSVGTAGIAPHVRLAIPSRANLAARDDPHGSVRLTLSEQQLFTMAAFKADSLPSARSRPSSPFPLLDAAPQTRRSFRKRAPAGRAASRNPQTPQAIEDCDPKLTCNGRSRAE